MNKKNTAKDTKHKAILDSATELLSLKPAATLQEIADYSNIGIATLHRHFASREALLDELAMDAVRLVENAFESLVLDPADAKCALNNLIQALVPLGNKISFLGDATYMCKNPEVIEEESRLKAPVIEIIGKLQENGQLRSDMPSKWIMEVLYDLLFVAWQEIRDGNLARNDASKLLLKTVLYGFSAL